MDEPASNLDPKSRRVLIELLNRFDHTKIIASHNLDLILDVYKRCLIIRESRVVADGPAEAILLNEALLDGNGLELPLCKQNFVDK